MRYKRIHLTQDQLRELIKHDALKGEVTWKKSRGCRRAGQHAGYSDKSGYRRIRIDGQRYQGSRVIWLLRTGIDPGDQQVDHPDGNKANNRFRNLRCHPVTESGQRAPIEAQHDGREGRVSWQGREVHRPGAKTSSMTRRAIATCARPVKN